MSSTVYLRQLLHSALYSQTEEWAVVPQPGIHRGESPPAAPLLVWEHLLGLGIEESLVPVWILSSGSHCNFEAVVPHTPKKVRLVLWSGTVLEI